MHSPICSHWIESFLLIQHDGLFCGWIWSWRHRAPFKTMKCTGIGRKWEFLRLHTHHFRKQCIWSLIRNARWHWSRSFEHRIRRIRCLQDCFHWGLWFLYGIFWKFKKMLKKLNWSWLHGQSVAMPYLKISDDRIQLWCAFQLLCSGYKEDCWQRLTIIILIWANTAQQCQIRLRI